MGKGPLSFFKFRIAGDKKSDCYLNFACLYWISLLEEWQSGLLRLS